ncbi:hypothetical protein [Methylobacterium nodulans]|uniref:Uncharacterized protein n=1 Tax=Methylobacterium nodulans (strain LMG 21967 / CNCM I-2342 / ORS 2060) TaxID=460265 RepID=B8IAP4_METNO|nr:hypothetical protein [Methylobacterium nodulans]ACL61089.1 hypothetical protein Mnod_6284 [Methylobacterium nodulans ORS 2060]
MRALPITITADSDRHFYLAVGSGESVQRAHGLCWDELIGLVGALTHPEVRSVPYGISKVRAVAPPDPEPNTAQPCVPRREEPAAPPAPEPMATIRIPLDQAEGLSSGMADLLCWAAGFRAALGDDLDRLPMGIEQTRETRRYLMDAIAKANGAEPEELPF